MNSHHESDNIHHHLGPFLTWVAERRSKRRTLLYTSRRKRKGLAPLVVTSAEISQISERDDVVNSFLYLLE